VKRHTTTRLLTKQYTTSTRLFPYTFKPCEFPYIHPPPPNLHIKRCVPIWTGPPLFGYSSSSTKLKEESSRASSCNSNPCLGLKTLILFPAIAERAVYYPALLGDRSQYLRPFLRHMARTTVAKTFVPLYVGYPSCCRRQAPNHLP
jgi:hypothetical protein